MGALPGHVVHAQLALVAPLEVSFGVDPYIQEKPNPRGTEIFANQSTVNIENKDFGTILVSVFTPERGISLPSSSPSTSR
jgi:hypothetical protein